MRWRKSDMRAAGISWPVFRLCLGVAGILAPLHPSSLSRNFGTTTRNQVLHYAARKLDFVFLHRAEKE